MKTVYPLQTKFAGGIKLQICLTNKINKCESKLFETLIWAETEGDRGFGPPLENHKLPFVS